MNIINDLKLQYKTGDMGTKLIFWNILLFLVPEVVCGLLKLFKIEIDYQVYIALSNNVLMLAFKPWTIISYAFFHGGFFHLIANMLMLHFVNRLFTTYFSQKQMFGLYFLGSIFAGFIYIVSYALLPLLANQNALLVGSSASVMAILIATTTYQPNMNIRMPLIGNIKLWHIAIVFLAIDLIQLPMNNTGGHLSHIGGAIFGFIFTKSLQYGTDLTKAFNKMVDWFVSLFSVKKATPFKKVHRNISPISKTNTTSKIVIKDKTQQQIDEILDKISQSGYDSLTKEEREFLFQAGK
jgi:membrane associated rhomboid family serine protease